MQNMTYYVSSLDKVENESDLCGMSGIIAKAPTIIQEKKDTIIPKPIVIVENPTQKFINDIIRPKGYITAYPEVFDKYSLIGYEITGTYFVNISLYNQKGREIRNLIKGTQLPGKYIIKLSGKNLNAGEYYCRLRFGNTTTDKILIKQ
jgi:hypothetical protein